MGESKIEISDTESMVLSNLILLAGAMDPISDAAWKMAEWKFTSFYDLLVTIDELRTIEKDEPELLPGHAIDVFITLARSGKLVGPYEEHTSQMIRDELVHELNQLDLAVLGGS